MDGLLTTENIIRGIREGQPVTPVVINENLIDHTIELIRQRRLKLNTQDAQTTRLMVLLDDALRFVRPEIRSSLANCEIYYLPMPLCLAYSDRIDDRNIIVVSQGMIDLIAHTIYSTNIFRLLPESLHHFYSLEHRPDLSVTELFVNALLLLRYHFFCFGEALPNVYPSLNQDVLTDADTAIRGSITFLILHELGHLSLGHLDRSPAARPMSVKQAIQDELTPAHQEELEADQFALDSLLEEAKVLGTFWHHHAIEFFTQLELVSGQRNETHPLALNRTFTSDILREQLGNDYNLAARPDHFQNLSRRFLATEEETRQQRNLFIQTSHAGCISVLKSVLSLLTEHTHSMPLSMEYDWLPWIDLPHHHLP